MRTLTALTRAAGISALLAVSALSTPAFAGKNDRAQEAIAVAKSKIEAADKLGASAEAAGLQMRARDSLRTAQDLLSHGKKDAAILEATHSGELADQALVMTDKRKVGAARDAQADAQGAAMDAQRSAARSEANADAAQQAAAAADTRAAAAQQQAATAQAQTDAMRAMPAAAPAPQTTVTTVQTEDREVVTPAAKPVVKRKVVRHHRTPHSVAHKTTITTTQQPQ